VRRRSRRLLATLAGPAALLLAGASTRAAETHPFSVLDMLAMDRISDPRVSPDGTRVAFTVRVTDMDANKGRNDIWVAALDGSGARRLTSHEANDTQARWAADGKTLYFVSTRAGSAQVFRLPADGGEPEQTSRLPLDVDAIEVVPGGKHLVLSMPVSPGKSPEETQKALEEKAKSKSTGQLYDRLFVRHWDTWADGTRNHLFAYDLASGKAKDLMPAMDADCPSKAMGDSADYAVSPDGRTVVFSARDVGREEAWSTNFDLFAVPLDGSAAPRKLTTNPGTDGHPAFSPDGKTLAYLSMARGGYEADRNRIVLRDWASGRETIHDLRADASPRGDRSPGSLAWTADGRELLSSPEHLGQQPVFAMDVATGKARILVGDGQTSDAQAAGAAGRILFARNSLLGPTELYTVSRDGKDVRRVTHLNDDKVVAARFGTPEPFTFKGAGADTVYGWLVRPVDFDAAKKYPVAFLIHGGPQGSFGNDFHYRWNPQAFAGAGYAAVMVDFHGSEGYGQAFTDAINGDWGGKPYEDLMTGLDYVLGRYSFLDGDRVAALGGSYGGYMVNWIAGHTDRFRCLVTHDGNIDERSAYLMTEELWFPEWEHGGVLWEKPEGFARHDPIDHIDKWKTPTLVVHGGKDYRVVYTQGLATFTALQRKGVPSKLLFFADENHWVLKPQNSKQWYDTVLAWLDEWTKPAKR
jgi:dipeptidyl aminopeptidase/acylaminoacyl peptidase